VFWGVCLLAKESFINPHSPEWEDRQFFEKLAGRLRA